MIKFKTQGPNGVLLGFGLSAENVRRLKQGQPIAIDLAELLDIPGQILIFYGETEADMAKTLKPFIGKSTAVHIEGENNDKRKH